MASKTVKLDDRQKGILAQLCDMMEDFVRLTHEDEDINGGDLVDSLTSWMASHDIQQGEMDTIYQALKSIRGAK